MMNIIEQKRAEIDRIDTELVYLLNKRFQACVAIGEAKKQGATAVLDPNREQNILNRLKDYEEFEGMVDTLWPQIMAYSRGLQSKL